MRVVAYVRVEPDDVPGGGAFWRGPAGEAQATAIVRWTAARGGTVVATALERAPPGLDHVGERVGFLSALSKVRDGEAGLVCVASLDRLDDDMVIQELLLYECNRSHVQIASARADDGDLLGDPPTDPARALVRRVIADAPLFQGELRSLRAWVRRTEYADGLDNLAPALAELEDMQAYGKAPPNLNRLARRLRLRRAEG
jgi:hypothetical protein